MAVKGKIKRNDLDLFSGFNPLLAKIFTYWSDRIVKVEELDSFLQVVEKLNNHLKSSNVIVFFDHHYAFDALPIGLLLGNVLQYLSGVIVPYAIHLDMGVGREGQISIRYWFRTHLYRWFTNNIKDSSLNIEFLPVVREFEMETPRLRQLVDKKYRGINTKYIRSLIRGFSENRNGYMCFLTPFSGIGFPGKPTLHPQLYRSIDIVRSKISQDVSFYFAGAYPSWGAYRSYFAPLMSPHNIVIQGPFSIPKRDYEGACNFLSEKLKILREAAEFYPPDYSRILMK